MSVDDTPQSTSTKSRLSVFTPERFLLAVIVLIAVLFIADRWRLSPFDRLKGWSVLTALTILALALVFLFAWYAASRLFGKQFRFSLRWLLLVVTTTAATLGWFAHELQSAERQKAIIAKIKASGGGLHYKWQMGDNARRPAPDWLCDLLGIDFFSNAYGVQSMAVDDVFAGNTWTCTDHDLDQLRYLDTLEFLSVSESPITNVGLSYLRDLKALAHLTLNDARITDEGLVHLQDHRGLKSLLLGGTQITSNGLGHLRQLENLEGLSLANTRITDDGLVHLAGMKKLRTISLMGTDVTDAGLKHLQPLSQLRKLSLHNTQVTDAAIAELRRALPNCDIEK